MLVPETPHMPPSYTQMSDTPDKVGIDTEPQHAVVPSSYKAHAAPLPNLTLATL